MGGGQIRRMAIGGLKFTFIPENTHMKQLFHAYSTGLVPASGYCPAALR
jgi:hypothetical protein